MSFFGERALINIKSIPFENGAVPGPPSKCQVRTAVVHSPHPYGDGTLHDHMAMKSSAGNGDGHRYALCEASSRVHRTALPRWCRLFLTVMQICFLLGMLIHFECCPVCVWISLPALGNKLFISIEITANRSRLQTVVSPAILFTAANSLHSDGEDGPRVLSGLSEDFLSCGRWKDDACNLGLRRTP